MEDNKKCERCGCDLGFVHGNTRYCRACSIKIGRERSKKQYQQNKEHIKKLSRQSYERRKVNNVKK